MSFFILLILKSKIVEVGELSIGSYNKIAIQSMTNTDTNNIEETIKQCKLLFDRGSELVRITVPSVKEVEKIREIIIKLRQDNYTKPIIADIHYNPKIALLTTPFVEKIRVNPGNYIEKKNILEAEAKTRLRNKFSPLLNECKKYNTAIRIGANWGSLSERILQKYGNTPLGMVKSVEDFIDICKSEDFNNVVISMKASDPRIMVQACRLLQNSMVLNKNVYPQHLGVTEAGNGIEARIKTAVGMATLLSEGIGDTLRVSLTENPVNELPVAKNIVKYFNYKNNKQTIDYTEIDRLKRDYSINNKYIVISNYNEESEGLLVPDFHYISNKNIKINSKNLYIIDFDKWEEKNNIFPVYNTTSYLHSEKYSNKYNFIIGNISDFSNKVISKIEGDNTSIIIIDFNELDDIFEIRNSYNSFIKKIKNTPIIVRKNYTETYDDFIIKSAGELGSIFIDKLCGGIWLQNINIAQSKVTETAFSILQATKVRISKTEYISCPTCGRTRFDIEKITNEIKQKTSQFKGITIAVMGCVVNGPGEMADADFGYVGAGNNKVHLYKNGKIIQKNIPQENAVDELLKLLIEQSFIK